MKNVRPFSPTAKTALVIEDMPRNQLQGEKVNAYFSVGNQKNPFQLDS